MGPHSLTRFLRLEPAPATRDIDAVIRLVVSHGAVLEAHGAREAVDAATVGVLALLSVTRLLSTNWGKSLPRNCEVLTSRLAVCLDN